MTDLILANKWGKAPWELSWFPDNVTHWDRMRWRYRWQLWQEQRAIWRKQQDTLDIIQLELMLNG